MSCLDCKNIIFKYKKRIACIMVMNQLLTTFKSLSFDKNMQAISRKQVALYRPGRSFPDYRMTFLYMEEANLIIGCPFPDQEDAVLIAGCIF
jgi:hypothetical protein